MTRDNEGKDILFLGTSEQVSKPQVIKLSEENPPKVSNGHIYFAYVQSQKRAKGKKGRVCRWDPVLTTPRFSKSKFIVRINTSSLLDGEEDGKVEELAGNPRMITRACGSNLTNGRVWADFLCSLIPGDAYRVHPEGSRGEEDHMVVANLGGSLICKPYLEFLDDLDRFEEEGEVDRDSLLEGSQQVGSRGLAPSHPNTEEDEEFIEPEDEASFEEFEREADDSIEKAMQDSQQSSMA